MKYEATFNSDIEIKSFYECFLWKLHARSNGRKTIHVETVLFAEFILQSLESSFWKYPVTVTYLDRPDFRIKSEMGYFGVEITEQWSNNYGQALSMLESSSGFLEPSDFFLPNEEKLKGDTIAKLVSKNELNGSGSEQSEEELNWIDRTIRTVARKNEKYIKYPDSKLFDENYLIIFDVRPEQPIFEDITSNMMHPLFSKLKNSVFSKLFCVDNKFIVIDLKNREFGLKDSIER